MITTEDTIVLLELDDAEDPFAPKDSKENLAPLETAETCDRPTVTNAFTGNGRSFDGASAFQAVDADDGDTLLTRDATIQAIVKITDLDGTWPRVLYCRGLGDGTDSERYSLGLELDRLDVPASPPHLVMRLFWMDSAGDLKTQEGGVFVHEDESRYLLLTASRRWDSSEAVACRYYVNEILVGDVTSVDGDIAGDTTGTTTIGCRFASDDPERFYVGVIDQLKVNNYEMPGSEVEAVWARLTTYQDIGHRLFATRVPPGSNWATPGTYFEKMGRIAGSILGYAMAKVEELRENFLPARAYSDILRRWERTYRIPTKAREPLDDRRERVLAVAGRTNGYAIPNVKEVLAEPLDLAEDDIEILEYTNQIDEPFDELRETRWLTELAEPAEMSFTAAGGELVMTCSAAAAGCRWDATHREHCRTIMSLASGAGALIVEAKLTDLDAYGDGVIAAILLMNYRTADSLWLGVKDEGGVLKVGYTKFMGGTLSAFVALENPAPGTPIYFRIRRDPDSQDDFALQWSDDAVTYASQTVTLAGFAPEFFGFAFHSTGAMPGDVSAKWDNARVITPEGDRPFHWFAFRDPDLDGTPNLNLANAVARRVTPAHAHGAAIISTSVICGDPIKGICGRGPMG